MKQKTITRLALSAVMCLSAISGRAQLTIGANAFQGCTSLKSVDVPSQATINNNAFEGCSSLTSFWAKNLSSYGTKVFYNCENLTYIGVGDFYKDVNGPNYLAKDGTLMEATVNTVIGSDIKTIGDYAFAGRGIKKINIPASVTKIGNYAFENCTALEEVQVKWDMPLSVPATTFEGVDCSNVTLYCPEDVEDFYGMVAVWKDFFTKAGEIDNERQYYAEVGKAGYATTYFPASVVVPEDVTAYYISAVSENGTSLVMHELEIIPANTGVLLHATAGMHTFNAANTETDALADNKLVKVAAGVNVPASNATNANYVLQKQDQVAFYKVTEPKQTSKPSAYLKLPTSSTNVKVFALDDDAVTAIQALTTDRNTEIYDLSGRKLSKLQKGINIVNGVKVLVK